MPIEQHPIPQDVAGYKFRLVGEMTLKQFLWLAVGIILGLVIYSSPLPFFFKYPFTVIAISLGAGIAFLPVEGRPLDKWLIAFIKSVYSPTQFVWQKVEEVPLTSAAQKGSAPAPGKGTGYVSPHLTPPVPPPPATPPSGATGGPAMYARDVNIPPAIKPKIEVSPPPQAGTPAPSPAGGGAGPVPTRPTGAVGPAAAARHDIQLPIPFTPTTPNILVGMTLTPEGKILDGALVEIKSNGVTSRATKSNQLGQFLFAKPLADGIYQIATEKTGFTFDTYSLNLTGAIVKPLRLQAKAVKSI